MANEQNIIELMDEKIEDVFEQMEKEIREEVESVDVDGKAFSRTSDIDSILNKNRELLKKYFRGVE